MTIITLSQILSLVGTLDDAPGDNTARERFRAFLKQNVTEVGQIRDCVQECRNTKGQQFYRALQDLVNHLGSALGFSVTFGRYSGVPGQVGSTACGTHPRGWSSLLRQRRTKRTRSKSRRCSTTLNELVSDGLISPDAPRLGLYVVANPDP
jgi:hypothetical protein